MDRFGGALKVLLALAVTALALGGVLLLTRMQPQPPSREELERETEQSTMEPRELLARSQQLESAFREAYELNMVGEEEIGQINEAINLQREYQRSLREFDPEASRRLEALEILRQNALARPIHAEAVRLREEAAAARAAGQQERYGELLQQALEKYLLVNQRFRESQFRDESAANQLRADVSSAQNKLGEALVQLASAPDVALAAGALKGTGGNGAHQQNFIDAVRSRKVEDLNTDVEVGHYSTGWCNLANVAYQAGERFSFADARQVGRGSQLWDSVLSDMDKLLKAHGLGIENAEIKLSPLLSIDPETEKFVGSNADAANKFLKREYRKGYEVPEIIA